MSWEFKKMEQLSQTQCDIRFDDAIQRFIREPDLPLTTEAFCEAMGVDRLPGSWRWNGEIVPAIESGRANAPIAAEAARIRNQQNAEINTKGEAWREQYPARLDVLYGVGTLKDNLVGDTVTVRPPRRYAVRSTAGGPTRLSRLQPAVLGGPRAYFDE